VELGILEEFGVSEGSNGAPPRSKFQGLLQHLRFCARLCPPQLLLLSPLLLKEWGHSGR
jgi:hypothetical protein